MNKSVKFWDNRASSYDNMAGKYEKSYQRIVDTSKEYLTKDDSVLDFACGTGLICNKLAADVKEITAIDTSIGMLNIAQEKAEEIKIENIHFIHGPLQDKNVINKNFDGVLAINVLHLILDIENTIIQIHDLLKPGGYFISSTACLKGKGMIMSKFLRFLGKLKIIPYIKSINSEELLHMIQKSNFEIVESVKLDQEPTNIFIIAKKMAE